MIDPHVHVPYDRIGEYLDVIRRYRINLEIYFSSHSLDTITEKSISKLKESLTYGPSLTVHAPFMDLSPGAVDEEIRSVTIKRFSQVFSVSEKLNPKCIVFHSGYEKWKYEKKIETWLKESIKTWPAFIQKAQAMKTKIAIENIFEDTPDNLRVLMEELACESFGICFDTGHCNIFTQVKLDEWLDQLSSYIIEFHLHDNNGEGDDHIAIGDGIFDFTTLFSTIKKKDIIYTIEAHTPEDTLKSIERLQAFIH
jgi:sugar phosphate isomerase/epimerase